MTDSWSARAHTRPGYATYADTPAGDPTSPYRPPTRPDQAAVNLIRHFNLPLDPWQEQVIRQAFSARPAHSRARWLPPEPVELVCPAGHCGWLPPLPESAYQPGATPLPLAPPMRRRWWRRPFRAKEA